MSHHQPPRDTSHHVSGWRCPLCLGGAYAQVTVARPNGDAYRTSFFECARCSVVFRDAGRFSRLGVPVRRWCGDVDPKTLAEAHRYWLGPTPEKPEG